MKKVSIVQWFQNMAAPAGNPSNGVYVYAESGVLKVRQADGTIVTVANSSGGSTRAFAFFMA